MGPTVVAFLVFVGLLFFDQFIEKGTVEFSNDLREQCYICHRRKLYFVFAPQSNFAEQNSFLFFNRLGRYWFQIQFQIQFQFQTFSLTKGTQFGASLDRVAIFFYSSKVR